MPILKILDVTLQDVIDADHEGFLDLLETLWMADYEEDRRGSLSAVEYRALGANITNGTIQIEVVAEEEGLPDEEEDTL